ncbi:MAG: type II toxin-antitoxin system VapC family toxin, partial [Deltaproteobacteria bacterium]|nr:type II toxin-antitoxin system VapC family toxin [Deltaproteobacteria bacterium]
SYYDQYRSLGKKVADKIWNNVNNSIVGVISELSDDVFFEAGRLKVEYKISLADTIALAETAVSGGTIITADHHELDKVEQNEPNIKFLWIR